MKDSFLGAEMLALHLIILILLYVFVPVVFWILVAIEVMVLLLKWTFTGVAKAADGGSKLSEIWKNPSKIKW